ncbi:MAG: glycosyltransferase [Pseudomonadota bacterium]
MKFAVVTLGSAGDLHPFLAIARALAERGHEVNLLTQAPYEAAVRAEGVRFTAIVGEREHQRTLQHPLLWHPLHGFGALWRHLAVPAIGPTIDALDALSRDGASQPLVVLASPLAAGARLARERWPERIRLVSGYTAPMGLRHIEDPLFLGAWQVPRWVPHLMRRALWAGLDHWKLEPMARPALAGWFERLALPRLSGSTFGEALHSPDGGLALYPAWFAQVPAEWRRRRVHQVGFPVFEPAPGPPAPPALAAFLAEPASYTVAYPGSAGGRASSFAERAVAASRAFGLKTLLLSRFPFAGPAGSNDVLQLEQVRLSGVLPQARAFVHHGGIGSVAQGVAAATPQLVVASAYDQFENGARLTRLGRARWLRESSPSRQSWQDSLSEAMETPASDDPPATEYSLPSAPNSAVAHAVALLEHMHDQLSLPGLSGSEERFPADAVLQRPGRTLEGYALFFALMPSADDAQRLARCGTRLIDEHRISGSRTAPDRLHASVCEVAQFAPGPDVERAPIDAAVTAANRLVANAMTLDFVTAASVRGGNAFVLQADARSQLAFNEFRKLLAAGLRKVGLHPSSPVPVHLTLAYGSRPWVEPVAIEPLSWRATRLVLILSHRGLTHHQWIKEWLLPDRSA